MSPRLACSPWQCFLYPHTCGEPHQEQLLQCLMVRVSMSGTQPSSWAQVPKIPLPPPFTEGLQLQDGKAVSQKLYDSLVAEVEQMNRAIELLPKLPPFEEQ